MSDETNILRSAVIATLRWAEQRCPCRNEKPDPCPLCGASAKPGGGPCLSAENTIPLYLLHELWRAARVAEREPIVSGTPKGLMP
jgi:hypothetical protein